MSEDKNPKPNQTVNRFKFKSRNRKSNELISESMVELPCVTQFCDCGTLLNDILRDRLVCWVNHNQIQQKLLRIVTKPGTSIKHCYISQINNQPVNVNKLISTAITT